MQLLKWFNSNNNIENKYFVDECLVMQVMLEKRKYKNNKKRERERERDSLYGDHKKPSNPGDRAKEEGIGRTCLFGNFTKVSQKYP